MKDELKSANELEMNEKIAQDAENTPAEKISADAANAPADEASTEQTPTDAPETPAENASADTANAPADEVSTEQTPTGAPETPAENVSADTTGAPADEASTEQTPTDAPETPAENVSADAAGAPADEVSTEQTPTGAPETPAENVSADTAGAPAKSKTKPIAITASAAIIAVIIIGIIIAVIVNANRLKAVDLPGNLTLRQFESRDQVAEELTRLQKESNQEAQKLYDDTVGRIAEESGLTEEDGVKKNVPNLAGVAQELVESFGETFKQIAGADESDIVKTDGKYIYCIDSDYADRDVVEIFKADGKDSEKAARVDIFDQESDATPDSAAKKEESEGWDYYSAYRSVDDIYVKDNRLIVIGTDSTPHNGSTASRTVTKVYDVSDINHITLLDTVTQSGAGKSTCMIDDTLYLVSSYTPFDVTYLPCCGRGDSPEELPADSLYTLQDNKTEKFLVVTAFNTLDPKAQPVSKAILGDVKDIYCHEDHMYIYADYGEKKKQFSLFNLINIESAQKSQILKLDLANSADFVAYTDLDGVIDNQYCLDEYDGNLRVATTLPNGMKETDHLYVLDNTLTTVGSLRNFAQGEYLAAVRYVDTTAYVVAYDLVDPIYTIDLSIPDKPMVMGKADLSGFSTMLEPVDDHTMLGLGYESMGIGDLMSEDAVKDGFKLVLFDVTNPYNPMIIDAKAYENCTSAVQSNPKALVYNPDSGEFIIPLNEEYWGKIDTEKGEYVESEDNRGGVLDFKVEKGRIKEVKHYETDHKSVERCACVGNTIYMTYRDSNDNLKLDTVK